MVMIPSSSIVSLQRIPIAWLLIWGSWVLSTRPARAWHMVPPSRKRSSKIHAATRPHAVPTTADTAPFSTIQDSLAFVDHLLLESPWTETEHEMRGRVDALHAEDVAAAEKSPLITSRDVDAASRSPPFDRIYLGNNRTTSASASHVVIRSNEPILSPSDVEEIRAAAQAIWDATSSSATSRFTYQYPGNSEAHVSDLSSTAIAVVNRALAETIYPLVGAAFHNADELCVYDALVIRYNATTTRGAGQPLHRDLGTVSVNIQLSPSSDFVGGGTLFEQQLGPTSKEKIQPLHPNGVGYGLAHSSTDRHAGAATVQGVRDILVLFLLPLSSTPSLRAARWMQCRSYCGDDNILCRLRHQRLAVDALGDDEHGQAYHYLGSALRDYSAQQTSQVDEVYPSDLVLHAAIACYRQAVALSPNDARIYNDWGIAARELDRPEEAEQVWQYAYDLLRQTEAAGCTMEEDMDRVSLQLGLCLADRDAFAEASCVLERTAQKAEIIDGRVVQDAAKLWSFCKGQLLRQTTNGSND